MTNELTQLFDSKQDNQTRGGNQLQETARLTSLANDIAGQVLASINGRMDELKPLVAKSQQSHDAMDELIESNYQLDTVDLTFLKALTEDEIDRMLKSQQSKRSRAKGKTMTLDNYKGMMVGAIAENLLRLASGKDKSATGARSSEIGFSSEQLEKLAGDPEALRREIRNVQSKKSIAKSKADFDPNGDRWQALLIVEEQLKNLRDSSYSEDPSTAEIKEALATVDLDNMKGADAKELLKKISAIITK